MPSSVDYQGLHTNFKFSKIDVNASSNILYLGLCRIRNEMPNFSHEKIGKYILWLKNLQCIVCNEKQSEFEETHPNWIRIKYLIKPSIILTAWNYCRLLHTFINLFMNRTKSAHIFNKFLTISTNIRMKETLFCNFFKSVN